jgi:hypothetical protein
MHIAVGSVMFARSLLVVAALLAVVPAHAGEMRPEDAKRFVAGKYFSYTCFEGTRGMGRIQADGSVAGTIQMRGSGPVHMMSLPAGTVRIQPDSICASVRGMPFSPCFNVYQIDSKSFRGSINGLGFAYCDFVRHNPRVDLAETTGTTGQVPQRPTLDTGKMRSSVTQ